MFLAPAFVTVNPSYIEPGVIMKYNQASGAFRLLHGGRPEIRLSEVDKAVYIKALDVRTKAAVGQNAYEMLPSVDVIADYISTPTYYVRNRFDFNHIDSAAAGTWGVSIDAALRLGSRQGIFQQLRNQLLFGVNANEGIVNMAGATSVSLPPDTNGNQTLGTYDNGQLAFYFMGLILGNETRMFQLGMEPLHTVIIGPQRILGPMQKQNIVQLVQFQRPGAGTMTTAGTISEIAAMTGDTIEWGYDDTLIGQGASGADLVIVLMPSVKNPKKMDAIDTNEFARLAPGLEATTIMYMDMAAPKEIRSPLPGGAVDVLLETLSTSGWGVRPEGCTLLSINP
jgi:hypothetical protein